MIESPMLSLKDPIVGVVLPFLNEIVALFIASVVIVYLCQTLPFYG